jgi:NADH-quinone oxidoreductase subunit L
MFHLFTHAFFKALLFLCAGIIIHQAHSNDMKSMGGYRRLMPLTHICFLIACLAIAGIPPFAGFFSKEQILSAALGANRLIYVVGVFTSGLTAFYMFRLYFSVFWGRPSHGHAAPAHGPAPHAIAHRTPPTEAIPLVILAIGAIFAGFVPFSHFVTADGVPVATHLELTSALLPVSVALAGILLAGFLYARPNDAPDRIARALGGFYQFVYHKFYIDEVYLFVTKKVIFPLVGRPAAWIDRNIVDGFMNALAGVTAMISGWIKGFQSGKLQDYVLYFFLGIAGLVVLFIYIYT